MVSAALVLALYARPVRAQSTLPANPDRPVLGSTITVDLLPELPTSVNLFSFFDAAQPDLISDPPHVRVQPPRAIHAGVRITF
jgi:hypothetical protein